MASQTTAPNVPTASYRSLAGGLATLRILFGLVYLSNALAKLVDISDFRIGSIGGNLIARANTRGILESAAQDTWLGPLGALYQSVVLPNWGFFIWFLIAAEFAIAFGLLFGVASRLAALGGLLLIGPIWLMLLDEGPYFWAYPVELVPLAIMAVVPTGRFAGLDGRLAARFRGHWPF